MTKVSLPSTSLGRVPPQMCQVANGLVSILHAASIRAVSGIIIVAMIDKFHFVERREKREERIRREEIR